MKKIEITVRSLVGLMGIFGFSVTFAGQAPEGGDLQAKSLSAWRESIMHIGAAEKGCFQTTYPSMVRERVVCQQGGRPGVKPVPPWQTKSKLGQFAKIDALSGPTPEVVGNTNDWAIGSAGRIGETIGTFSSITSGSTVSGDDYSIQLNSNFGGVTAACNSHPACTVWQQFIYSTNYYQKNQGAVFMQYWLRDYGSSCPSGWLHGGGSPNDCYRDGSQHLVLRNVPLADLTKVVFIADAASGGNDTFTFIDNGNSYVVSESDSILDLASVWNQSEFNIVGGIYVPMANFSPGTEIGINIAIRDGTSSKPSCIYNGGTTGETSNLSLGGCDAYGGQVPSIRFTESN